MFAEMLSAISSPVSAGVVVCARADWTQVKLVEEMMRIVHQMKNFFKILASLQHYSQQIQKKLAQLRAGMVQTNVMSFDRHLICRDELREVVDCDSFGLRLGGREIAVVPSAASAKPQYAFSAFPLSRYSECHSRHECEIDLNLISWCKFLFELCEVDQFLSIT